jgi:2'-5' RNA ligase
MANPTQKYCLVSLLENTPVGVEFHFKDWPLHLTLVGVFSLPNITKLLQRISEIARSLQPFSLLADEAAQWGEEGQIHVMKLKVTPEISQLHTMLLELLRNADAQFNEERYLGDGYTPHITNQKHASIQSGETVNVSNISLIDMFVGSDWQQRKILWTVPFDPN